MKKLFGEIKMTWIRVILYAIIIGIVVGMILNIPMLDPTSFHDIGVYLDWWFLFAIIIVKNCKKWHEASLKCFVFFLISQPLIYLVQVPFNRLGWGIFMYYKRWFIITLLVLPGAVIAYLLKKKNWISVAILCVPIIYYANAAVSYFAWFTRSMPNHILSALFAAACVAGLPIVLLDDKKQRLAVYIVGLLMAAGTVAVPGVRLI